MGTFGHKIFQDDFAIEIREQYIDKLFAGLSGEEASKEMIQENQGLDIDEEPVFWLSLAATQWEYGRLLESVKENAIRVIDDGSDLVKWNRDKKRIKELETLKNKLNSNQPKQKKLIKKKIDIVSGDIFIFPLDSTSFAFGQVLIDNFVAIYKFKTEDKKYPVNEIIKNKIAFVVGYINDGFYSRKWKVIGNHPLGEDLKQPIYFFHQAVMSKECEVFNVWESRTERVIQEDQCIKMDWGIFGIEQWGAYSSDNIIDRLTARLENRHYKSYIHPEWENLHFRKGRKE